MHGGILVFCFSLGRKVKCMNIFKYMSAVLRIARYFQNKLFKSPGKRKERT